MGVDEDFGAMNTLSLMQILALPIHAPAQMEALQPNAHRLKVRLPDQRHFVVFECGIRGNDGEFFELPLGDKHSVKWISVTPG